MTGICPKQKSTFKDNYVQFGSNIVINYKKLENNTLLIKYSKSFGPINKLRATKISDELKQFIIEIIQTDKINVDFQKQLNANDVSLFDKLIDICRIRTHLQYKRYIPNIDDHISRFNLLRAGLNAGNESIELRRELVELLTLLSSPLINKITKNDADEFIEMLS